MPMTNEQRIRRSDDDEIVHAEQRNLRAVFVEDDVVRGIAAP